MAHLLLAHLVLCHLVPQCVELTLQSCTLILTGANMGSMAGGDTCFQHTMQEPDVPSRQGMPTAPGLLGEHFLAHVQPCARIANACN